MVYIDIEEAKGLGTEQKRELRGNTTIENRKLGTMDTNTLEFKIPYNIS